MDKDWKETRNPGRRDSDVGVCIWHDVCHETVASMRQSIIELTKDNHEEHKEMDKEISVVKERKLDR